jgi:KaiC/GvpD/RAD55 family RecA-like ATPase
MSKLAFKKAERTKAKLKLAITGPSGSGKTMSALRLAKGIGGRIALIDTENESASLYSDRFEFDTLALSPPYTTDKYLEALKAAMDAQYDVVIIDSISHQWAGEGGILNRKEQLDSQLGQAHSRAREVQVSHSSLQYSLDCDNALKTRVRAH